MKNVSTTRFKTAKSLLASGLLAVGCTAIGANALALESPAAAKASWQVSLPVRYSDLDVSTMKGAEILYSRIRYAATTLCQSAATWGKQEGEACMRKAVNDAVVRVDSPLLSQYHQLRSKGDKEGLARLAKIN